MTSFVRRLPGVTRDVPAGLIDAGTASLAHFLVGLASVNLLDEANLGVYAVFFAAFIHRPDTVTGSPSTVPVSL